MKNYYLNPGDTVDIVAPSSKCHPSVADKMKTLLESWGLNCHVPDDLFGESLLYANSEERRFSILKDALLNTTSKAIWPLLGGYGATKIIPLLEKISPPTHSKIFIGFSDVTALHIFFQNKWGWKTLHGPSGYQVCHNRISSDSIELLKKTLLDKEYSPAYSQIIPLNTAAKANLTLQAPIIGGNLHLIQTTLGTSWQINADNKILFIEEVNERAYRIDRILAHLSQAGVFNNVKAMLFGDIIDKGEPDGKPLSLSVIKEFASQQPFPVLQISNIGHGEINYPLLLGSTVELKMGNQYLLHEGNNR